MAKAKVAPEGGFVSRATLGTVRVSPRKARLVADLIRGLRVEHALDVLTRSDKKTSPLLRKLILSAVANAVNKASVDADELFVKRVSVDEGTILYRFMPRAQGRATKIRKRSSSITVHLDEVGAR